MAAGSTFKLLIEEIVGETDNDSALSSFLIDAAREVQDGLDKDEALTVSKSVTLESGTYATLNKKVLQVLKRSNITNSIYYVPAVKVNVKMAGKVTDSNSIYAAEESSPVWYVEQSTTGVQALTVVPTPTSTYPATIYYLDLPEVAFGDSAFTSGQLPENAKTAVILGASIMWLKRKMSEMILDDGDAELSQALTQEIDVLGKQYQGEMQRLSKVIEHRDIA